MSDQQVSDWLRRKMDEKKKEEEKMAEKKEEEEKKKEDDKFLKNLKSSYVGMGSAAAAVGEVLEEKR